MGVHRRTQMAGQLPVVQWRMSRQRARLPRAVFRKVDL
jgi:hypothetical protein